MKLTVENVLAALPTNKTDLRVWIKSNGWTESAVSVFFEANASVLVKGGLKLTGSSYSSTQVRIGKHTYQSIERKRK